VEWDHRFDTVVIGSGVGGLVGAVTAKAHGLEPLLIEKTELLGGSSAMSGGVLWVPDNPLMRRENVPDSYAEGMAYLQAVVGDAGPASNPRRRHVYLAKSVELVEFLEDRGLRFLRCEGYSDYYDEATGGKSRGRSIEPVPWDGRKLGAWEPTLRPGMAASIGVAVLTGEVARFAMALRTLAGLRTAARVIGRTVLGKLLGKHLLTNGASLIGQLLKIAVEDGVTIWTRTALTELVEENGRITGVVAAKDGREIRIKADRGVLINAGGFARNGEMRTKFGQRNEGKWTLANPGDTGEAIEAAMRHGAAVDLVDDAWWLPGFILPDGTPAASIADRTRPGSIIVDSGGQRYCDEAASYMEVGQAMIARDAQDGVTAVPSYLIFDQSYRNRYSLSTALPGRTPREWLDSGFLTRADTLAELARRRGIDETGLADTVARFNRFAADGQDPDFHRGERAYDRYHGDPRAPHPTLGPIVTPPFYALEMYPVDVGTSGGLLTDERARVLTERGEPIPGLYASGNSTASVMGRRYPGAGASIGASAVFSYVAMLDAASARTVSRQT
jgi:3-oxosteroid 1-dehydrogenase